METTAWAYGSNLVWAGGGHSIRLPDRFAYTVHIYNFARDFIRALFKDFPVGHFLKRDLSVS